MSRKTSVVEESGSPTLTAEPRPATTPTQPRQPRVSVCVPTYNGERHIVATLRSILANDLDDYEVVVLDNNSSDATVALVEAIDDRRIRLEHNDTVLSLPDNWRRVVELTRGHYVKVVCDDDLIGPDALAVQARILDEQPGCSLVAHPRDLIDDDGRKLAARVGMWGLAGRHSGRQVARVVVRLGINPLGESAGVMFRRQDYEAIGGFDGRRVYPMDIDIWMRLLQLGYLYGGREALAAFRLSSEGLSAAHSSAQYRENASYMAEIATDAYWQVPALDRWLSHVSQPAAWLAWSVRHQLFGVTGRLGLRRGSAKRRSDGATGGPPSTA